MPFLFLLALLNVERSLLTFFLSFFFYARFCFRSHSPARGRTIPQRIPFLPSSNPRSTPLNHTLSHIHIHTRTIYRDNMIYNIYGVRTVCMYCVRYEFEINNAYGIRNIVLQYSFLFDGVGTGDEADCAFKTQHNIILYTIYGTVCAHCV